MDSNTQYELYLIGKDLDKVIKELYDIAFVLRTQFSGIGSDLCAECVSKVASNYQKARNKLNNMDLSDVTEEFASQNDQG